MRVAIGCDHAGFPMKAIVVDAVKYAGHETIDVGTYNTERVDFPDFVEKACHLIQTGEAERAIVICGSGVGACIAANKMKGVYASICHDTYSAHQGVEHDDMNTLCIGGRIIGPEPVGEIVQAFLGARFYKDQERFVRRVDKIKRIEQQELG